MSFSEWQKARNLGSQEFGGFTRRLGNPQGISQFFQPAPPLPRSSFLCVCWIIVYFNATKATRGFSVLFCFFYGFFVGFFVPSLLSFLFVVVGAGVDAFAERR